MTSYIALTGHVEYLPGIHSRSF